MTVHNLKEHLKWLVTSNPVKPPPLGLTASSAEAGNTGTVVDGIPYAPNLQVENIVPDVRANEVDHHNFRESQPEIPSPLSHSTSYAETGIMARLQSAPRSGTKSRLLSQMMTAPLRTPRASQSQTPSASLQNRFDQGTSGRPRTVKAVEQKKYQLQTPATSTARERLISTGTSVDLSGEVELQNSSSAEEVFGESRQIWREDSAARKEPLSKIGKKRKSEELEVGVVDGIHTPHLSQSSFIAVDAYPDEAPPPYSRIFPESFPPNSRTTDQSSSQRIRPETHKTNLNQSSPPSKRTKHVPKNPQTPRREAMPLLRELRQAGLNVPVESRYAKSVFCGEAVKPENTIADSEDEGSEVELEESAEAPNMDDVITVKEEIGETIYPVLPKIAATTGMNPSRVRFETGRALDTATTKAELNPSASCFTRTSSDPSPFQHDSPTKLASEQVRQQHKSSDSLGNIARGLTNKERDSVNCFMNLPPYCVENYRGSLHLARTSNAEKLYICLVEGGIGSPEMQQESASLKVKIDALDILIRLKNDYVKVNRHKEELKRRIITAIQDDQDLSTYAQDLAKSKAIAEDLLKIELQISNSLAKAALPLTDAQPLSYSHASKIPDSTDNSDKRSTLLVQATQNPQQYQNLRAPEKRVSLAHAPATTQYVQQTQVLDTSPRTPKKLAQTNFSQIQRSPLRTYTSSPRTKDVNAYFSPSKRKPRFEEPVTDAKTRQRLDIDMVKPSIGSQPKHSHQIVEEYDLEEETFSANMASPLQAFVDEDDYGHDVDDEEMLEVTEEFESRSLLPSAGYGAERRQVFAETTGNVIRLEKPKSRSSQTNAAAQASHMQHVWSRDVKAAMKERFHLRGFRPNQLEAINATLSGKDTFVLMPTGGGKSLCYQLPSIIKSGKTRGVTVVISPLLSLMQDQVAHLQNLKIQALLINSEVTTEHRRLVMESLRDPQVEKYIQLLYITPEMLSKSQAIISAFRDLYQRQKLARIVIDEAHCVSQWGHDFRPDYKLLGQVRGQFKGVPVMALTATATENVKVDVIHNLGIENCEVLTQSFNRPNLTYDVRSKGKGKEVLDDIVTTIKTLYKNQSGIIYCLSRKNCESIAEKLRNEHHIMAYHYHAGMDPGEKTSVQKQWQAGIYHVIVATIAFGMGIDKPDVRFVIHHTIPKSLEGYYQETGRAGRDGKRSGCYLYYGYQDINALKRMIDDGEGSWEQKERQRQMLRNMFSFCENRSDCRRVQVLNYFNESYNREDCNGACDNCNSKCSFESQDFSKFAIAAITLVKKIEQDSVTLLHCVDVFRGGKTKKITSLKHSILEEYGAGSQLERGDVERLFYRLLSEDALAEENKVNKGGFATNYLHLGKNWGDFIKGRRKVKIQIRVSPNGKKTASKQPIKNRGTGVAASKQENPLSTNISSPIQAASRRRIAQYSRTAPAANLSLNGYTRDGFVISDRDADSLDELNADSEDAFEDVREAGKPRKSKKRDLGPPITIDKKLERLNPTHRMVVEDFIIQAKQESAHILISRNLRAHPFTDTVLREMAINFPKDEREMLEIPGIDPDKVQRYCKRFLKLIRHSQQGYEAMMQQQEDHPQDPNHENVIIISSEDESADDDQQDDPGDENGSQEERSAYFQAAPEVDAFNARFSQLQSVAAAPPHAQSQPQEFKGRTLGRGSSGRGRYKRYSRKLSAGAAQSKAPAKYTKNQLANGRTSDNYSGGGSSRQGKGGQGFGGGIGMMPI